MKSWEEKNIKTNGINMRYLTAGKGPLLVLLHGFPQFSYTWRRQIPELSKDFCVVAPDLRGYGGTDRPPDVSDYSSEKLAGDIVGLIQALGYEKAHIVGHDWGGVVAWNLALNHPQIVDRLIVLNCPHPKLFATALRSNYRQMLKSWYIFFFQLPYVPEGVFKMFSGQFVKGILRGTATRKDVFSDEDLEIYRKELEKPGAFHAAVNYYRAAFQKKSHQGQKKTKVEKITAPTLLIWGEGDPVFRKDLSLGMEPLFDGPFKVHYIPNCSHWVNEEQPDVVNRLILSHLRG